MSYLVRLNLSSTALPVALACVALLACSGAPDKGTTRQEQAARPVTPDLLSTDDDFEIRYDRASGRFAHLSTPGLRIELARAAEPMGVTLRDHQSNVLLHPGGAPVREARFEAADQGESLRLVRESAEHGLRLEELWIARANHIELQATIVDTRGVDTRGVDTRGVGAGQPAERAIEACLVVPANLIGKTWHHHLHQAETIAPDRIYRALLTESLDIGHWSPAGDGAHFKSDLLFNLHGLNLIGDDASGLALAMHPDAPASYYVEYDAGRERLSACFHLGIYGGHKTRPNSTDFRLLLFHPDEPRWGLGAALAKYAAVVPSGFRGRLPRQVGMTSGGAYNFAHYPDPRAFHIAAMWNAFYPRNRAIAVQNLLYAWPTGFIDRGMRLALEPVQQPCSDCDSSADAHIAACLAIYRDYEEGRLRFPMLCQDAWSRTRCQSNPVTPRQPREYGPIFWQGGYYTLRPVMVGEPSNLALRLFGKFAMHQPMSASILRDLRGGHASALSSPRAIAAVDKDTFTCFINGINPDPGVDSLAAAQASVARRRAARTVNDEPPLTTANFGQLNLEVAKRATGVYGPEYIHADARNGPMVYDGVAVDTVGAYLRPDFHPAMLAVASLPLGYDPATGRVAAMEHLSLSAWLGAVRQSMPEGAALAINGYPVSGTLGQGVDHFVRELGRRWRKEPGDAEPRFYNELYDEDLATRLRRIYRQRMVAYQRPITFWARFVDTEKRAGERGLTPQAMLLRDMQHYLPLYTAKGIYVYIQRTGIGKRDLFFMQPQDPAVLVEYEKHLDTVDALTRAGWEPIPRIIASHPDISVERFGNGLFTLYNGGPGARRFSARVAWKQLGHAASGLRVRDFETGQALRHTVAGDQVTIPDLELLPNAVKILVMDRASE